MEIPMLAAGELRLPVNRLNAERAARPGCAKQSQFPETGCFDAMVRWAGKGVVERQNAVAHAELFTEKAP